MKNKDNYTNGVIKKSNRFSVSIITNDTTLDSIGMFGYHSSSDVSKFDSVSYDVVDGVPVVLDNVCGYLICEVINVVDCGTHDIFLAKIMRNPLKRLTLSG